MYASHASLNMFSDTKPTLLSPLVLKDILTLPNFVAMSRKISLNLFLIDCYTYIYASKRGTDLRRSPWVKGTTLNMVHVSILVFPTGLPCWYCPSLPVLNFRVRTGSGVLTRVWPTHINPLLFSIRYGTSRLWGCNGAMGYGPNVHIWFLGRDTIMTSQVEPQQIAEQSLLSCLQH